MTEDRKLHRTAGRITALPRSLLTSLAAVMGIGAGVVWSAPAVASQALAQKYTCVACHQASAKGVGPSWKDIGAKYGDGKGTAAQLAASIKTGSSGKWGAMPMPAQAQVPEADARLLAQWLLDGAK